MRDANSGGNQSSVRERVESCSPALPSRTGSDLALVPEAENSRPAGPNRSGPVRNLSTGRSQRLTAQSQTAKVKRSLPTLVAIRSRSLGTTMRVVQPLEIAYHASDPVGPRADRGRPDGWSTLDVIVEVEVALLSPGRSLRHTPVDGDHLSRLVATGGDWPPLLVNRLDLTVIDGRHRLMAALELNLRTIRVEFFSGTETDAFLEALERNAAHGLPLTLSERKDAASTLLAFRPAWSDRMIGDLCGISGRTIRELRQRRAARAEETSTAEIVQLERRVGRDGRNRPAKPAEQRQRIIEALSETPGASLRSIASRTGASPATVRAVRQRVGNGSPGHPARLVAPDPSPPADGTSTVAPDDPAAVLGDIADDTELAETVDIGSWPAGKVWASDTACSSAEGSMKFARWFDRTRVDVSACLRHLADVPLSRVYEVADESMRRAQAWGEFAAALQRRPAHNR